MQKTTNALGISDFKIYDLCDLLFVYLQIRPNVQTYNKTSHHHKFMKCKATERSRRQDEKIA